MRHALVHALGELRRRLPGPATQDLTIDEMVALREAAGGEMKGATVRLEEVRLQAPLLPGATPNR